MDNPPDYPPPPSEPPPPPPPPPSEPPPFEAPRSAPAPYYESYGQPMAPPPPQRSSRQLWTILSAVAVVAVLVAIAGVYGVVGYSSASSKVNAANHAIDATVSHRASLDGAPSSLDLEQSDVKAFQADAARWMQTWKDQSTTIANDDKSLATAGSRLHDQQWLTLLRQDSVNTASSRVGHARKALKAATAIATARQTEGKFLSSYAKFLNDLETFLTDEQAGNAVSALAAAGALPNDISQSIKLAADPQFPPELRQYLLSLQAVSQDLVDFLNAESSGDAAKIKAIQDKTNKDIDAGKQIDITQLSTNVDVYYQPFIDTYHTELARAQGGG